MDKKNFSLVTDTAQKTMELGKTIAAFLKPNTIIALCGRLGSGKTTLAKGIAQGLGIDERSVVSPSFVLMREYSSGRLPFFHSDLYRLEPKARVMDFGVEDYLNRNGVLVVEWADKTKGVLPLEYLRISVNSLSKNRRRFSFSANGVRHRDILIKITKKLRFKKKK